MRKYNSPEPSGPVLGKANKYWTLWEVMKPRTVINWYGKQVVQDFNYIQNLSFEKDSAVEKMNERYDSFRTDETLKGSSSYSNELSDIEWSDDVFLFGKYKQRKFEDVDDIDYKKWYYGQVKDTPKDSDVLKDELSNFLIEFDGETIWVDQLENKALKLYEENFRKRVHLGTKGQVYEYWVRLRDVRTIRTSYGPMTIWEFVDQDGHLVFYKGSKDLKIEKDQIVRIRGKIKHEEYYSSYHGKVVQETSLKYPKIVKK